MFSKVTHILCIDVDFHKNIKGNQWCICCYLYQLNITNFTYDWSFIYSSYSSYCVNLKIRLTNIISSAKNMKSLGWVYDIAYKSVEHMWHIRSVSIGNTANLSNIIAQKYIPVTHKSQNKRTYTFRYIPHYFAIEQYLLHQTLIMNWIKETIRKRYMTLEYGLTWIWHVRSTVISFVINFVMVEIGDHETPPLCV